MSLLSMTIYNIYFFICNCLYCLHHNLFAYVVCWYWLEQSREITRTRAILLANKNTAVC